MAETPPNSLHPKTRAEWRAWLEENHTRREGVWLISYKKATGPLYTLVDAQWVSHYEQFGFGCAPPAAQFPPGVPLRREAPPGGAAMPLLDAARAEG